MKKQLIIQSMAVILAVFNLSSAAFGNLEEAAIPSLTVDLQPGSHGSGDFLRFYSGQDLTKNYGQLYHMEEATDKFTFSARYNGIMVLLEVPCAKNGLLFTCNSDVASVVVDDSASARTISIQFKGSSAQVYKGKTDFEGLAETMEKLRGADARDHAAEAKHKAELDEHIYDCQDNKGNWICEKSGN